MNPNALYDNIVSSFSEFVNSNNLMREASVPVISYFSDDCNPRSSKIGGKFPYLPNEEIPLCSSCKQFPMMALQLYVPSLPEFIIDLFPDDMKQSLVVLSICPSCLGSKGFNVRTYNDEQLDELVYHDDVGKEWSELPLIMQRSFNVGPNSPHTYSQFDMKKQYIQFASIQSWNDTMMAPYPSVDEVKKLMKANHIDTNNRSFLAAHSINMQNKISGCSYLGGWPCFCKKDLTPEGYKILFNFCESEACSLEWGNGGTAQLWIGTDENSGKFKFTCSSYY